jgi:predicted transcriptional regulator of viral defense system
MSVVMTTYRRSGTKNKVRSPEDRLLTLARESGILRSRDLAGHDLPRVALTRLLRQGRLRRVARGLYVLANADLSEHHTLVEACKRIPHGTVCLLSALRFHELTTQAPYEVWMAIDVKARKPRVGDLPLKIVRFSGEARTHGVETHRVEGAAIRVTSPAKTVADCFKYRNKVGLTVAIEALRDFRRSRKSMDDLWRAAAVCRVTTVMQPYLESLR